MKARKLLRRAISKPASLSFAEAMALAEAFGFGLSRVQGSHHIMACPGVPQLVNLQNVHGQAKPYQVRQLLKLAEKHSLTLKG